MAFPRIFCDIAFVALVALASYLVTIAVLGVLAMRPVKAQQEFTVAAILAVRG